MSVAEDARNGRAAHSPIPDIGQLKARLEEMTAPLVAERDQVESAIADTEAMLTEMREHRRRLSTIIRAMEGGSLGGKPNGKQPKQDARKLVSVTPEHREAFMAVMRQAKRPLTFIEIKNAAHLSPKHTRALIDRLQQESILRDCGRSEEPMPGDPSRQSTARTYILFPEHQHG